MGKYTWIVVIVILLWQVIGGAVSNASKKQQRERMADAAEERRRQLGGKGAGTPPARSAGGGEAPPRAVGASPGGQTLSARMEDLAARRKAQLDELRRRRAAAKGTSVSTAQVRPSTPRPTAVARARPAAAVPAPVRDRAIREIKTGARGVRAAEEARKRELQAKFDREHAAQAAAERREQEADKRRRAEKDARRARQAAAGLDTGAVTVATRERRERTRHRGHLQALLADRVTLRNLFIMKELLDPPIALRSGPPTH